RMSLIKLAMGKPSAWAREAPGWYCRIAKGSQVPGVGPRIQRQGDARPETRYPGPGSDTGVLAATLFDDASVEEVDGTVRVRRVPWIVRDHADGGAAAMQLAEQFHHRFAVRGVEVTRRLVGEEDERIAGDGTRDGHTLLLTAGELCRIVLHAVAHAHALECVGDALLALGRRHAAIGERQLDVLVDREIADEVERLEDEADLAIPNAGALRRRELGNG